MTDSDQSTPQGSFDCAAAGPCVRFDSECVLIPETPTKSPKILTKSYSLPLWRRRSTSDASALETSPDPAGSLVVRLPMPNFRGRAPPISHDNKPMSPCIVHRDPTSPKPRRASLSRPPGSPKLHTDITIPLRSCCEGCITVTEECTRVGEAWKVKFTSGARRKIRRASMNDAGSALTFEKIKVDEVADSSKRKKLAAAIDMDRTLFPLPSPPPLSPSHIVRSEFPWASGSAIAESPSELGVLDNAQPLGRKPQPDREISGGGSGITHLDPISEATTPIVSRCTSPLPHGTSESEKDGGAGALPGRPASSPSSDAIASPLAPQGSGVEAPVHPVQEDSQAVLPSNPWPSTNLTPATNYPSQYLAQGTPPPPPLVSSSPSTTYSSPGSDSEKSVPPPSTPNMGSPRSPSKVKRTSFSGSIFRTGAGILKGVSSTMGGISV